ncbi:hypothetical protein [Paludisphaera mucosa]|uniref:Uncharacterized protein n=1 Tax=Paludisphaera mucosa TaxID=3030827 RepID=A0ABT6FHG2_9BACT|nr:hypothetical protein [Paludisphaera mucosa]MDG3007023.1 hypothetical protein [Paludisphaera mucosa]
MATQRITIAKVGGIAADVILRRLQGWAAARQTAEPEEWSNDQWPSSVRVQVDAFADRLRANSLFPPVVHFIEWSDLWSMGDLFGRWLTPPGGPPPFVIHADRFELYGYSLPDGGRLGRHLTAAGPQQFDEYDQFVDRLHEALTASQELTEQAVIIVLREVVGSLQTDDDLLASLSIVPAWLVE